MVIDKDLLQYVREARNFGLNDRQIFDELLKTGWPADYLKVLVIDKSLLDYMSEARAFGMGEESIAQELLKQGWPADYLRAAFAMYPSVSAAGPVAAARQQPQFALAGPSVLTYVLGLWGVVLIIPSIIITIFFARAMVLSWLSAFSDIEWLNLVVMPLVLSVIVVPFGLIAADVANRRLVAAPHTLMARLVYLALAGYQTLAALITSAWLVFLIGRFIA